MTYTEYYKGFLIEIWKDATFSAPRFWVFGVRVDFDNWLRGHVGTDFEAAQRSARYEVMAYIALEKIPEPNFRIGQSVLSLPENAEYIVSDSTWHRGEQLWYYRGGGPWLPETQLVPPGNQRLKGKML